MSRELPDTSRVNVPLKQAIEALLTDRPIAYHPIITRVVGSATAGIFLSQLLYWTPRAHDPEGWVYKTQDDILEETGLTRTEQETARRILRGAQVMEEQKKGLPAKLYFRVKMDQLIELLASFQPKPGKRRRPAEALPVGSGVPRQGSSDAADKDAGILQPRMRESRRPVRSNTADKRAAYPQTLTEITTETTTENVVVAALRECGISTAVAEQLAVGHGEPYIRTKIAYLAHLQAAHSSQVKKNPAGWLRRAIEEDYAAPAGYKSPEEREAEERERAASLAAAQEARRRADAEYARTKEIDRQQLEAACPPQPIPGAALTTKEAWERTLAELAAGQVTRLNFEVWLNHTALVSCDGTRAVIVAPSSLHTKHLAERLTQYITPTLSTVLGAPIRCEYIALGELPEATTTNPTDGGGAQPRRPGGGVVSAAG
jgi:hypothetical protein